MKKIFLVIVAIVLSSIFGSTFAQVGIPPSYDDDFANYLLESESSTYGEETVYNLGIQKNRTLAYNIRCLFYPNAFPVPGCDSVASGGKLRDVVRNIGFAFFFLFVVIIGINLLLNDPKDSEKIKKLFKSFYRIAIGAVIFFGGTWFLGSILSFDTISNTQELLNSLQSGPDSFFFKILSLLKGLAFFIAIILIAVYGFRILSSLDKIEETKKQAKGVLYVLITLMFIKVIDYIYYIAAQKDFAVKGVDFIIDIAKIIGFIIGFVAVLMIFYAGFLLFTDQGSSEKMKQAKNIIVNILLVSVVIFIFLLILYQLFKEFG